MRSSSSTTTRSRLARNLAALVVGSTALLACGDDDSSSMGTTASSPAADAPADAGSVTIERSRFAPEELTVPAGTTVEFVNLDPFAHTVTAAEGSDVDYDSGKIGQDESYEQTFDEPGSYDYFCEIHPTMRATVVVE